jgi:hypothetical protein
VSPTRPDPSLSERGDKRVFDFDESEGVLLEAKPSRVEWLALYTQWLLLAMLAVTTVVLFLHARAETSFTFDGCFKGVREGNTTFVTYGEDCE